MVEYLYNTIMAVAGQDITIYALITDDDEQVITTGCSLVLYSDEEELVRVDGIYFPENLQWEFTIPANATSGRDGRYWYCLRREGKDLCFKQPIYLEY